MIWETLIVAVFSLACWQDGEIWKSGVCAGIALAMGFIELRKYVKFHAASSHE